MNRKDARFVAVAVLPLALLSAACGEPATDEWPALEVAVAPVQPMGRIEGATFPAPTVDCASAMSFSNDSASGSEAGFVATRSGRMFYTYHPHTGEDPDAPLLVLANGGGNTMIVLLAGGTSPNNVVWENEVLSEPTPNEVSWTRFAHLLYVETPGAGFSYLMGGAPPPSNRMIAATEHVQLILTFLNCRMDRPDRLVGLVGESAAGAFLPMILWHLHHPAGGDVMLDGNWTSDDQDALQHLVLTHVARVAEGRGEPGREHTSERIARQFFGQVLIQGALPDSSNMLNEQWNTDVGEREFPIRQFAEHGHPGPVRAREAFRDADESRVMFGVALDTIPWMSPAARVEESARTSRAPTYLADALGPLADGDTYYGRSDHDMILGGPFNGLYVESLRWTAMLMTDALRDRSVLSPAYGQLLEDQGLIADHRLRDGWLDVELLDGTRASVRNPRIDSVHTVSLDKPRELAREVEEWLLQVRSGT